MQSNESILVVDDDAAISRTYARGLRRVGYHCEIAGTADEADRTLQSKEFDLMLLDIGMPGKSGMQFLTELRERYPHMAIVMVTGNDELDTAVSAMREGANDYIVKPVPLTLLAFRVEQVLSRRALILENNAYRELLEGMVEQLNLCLEQSRREEADLLQSVVEQLNLRLEVSRPEMPL